MMLSQLALGLGLLPTALGLCTYQLSGSIVNDPIIGWSWSGHLDDSWGNIICGQGAGDSGGYQDENGSWHLECGWPGVSFTLSGATAGTATVVNNGATDSWSTGASPDFYDCYGACQDGGVCLQCTQYDFTSDFGCTD